MGLIEITPIYTKEELGEKIEELVGLALVGGLNEKEINEVLEESMFLI